MERDDEKLIADYVAGDEDALAVLVSRHLKSVYNFAYRITGSKRDAEDVAQETFVKVWRGIAGYKPNKRFKSWLFSIARNTAIDFLRKKKELPLSYFEDDEGQNAILDTLKDVAPSHEEMMIRAEDTEALEAVLKKLPLRYREVLLLHYNEGLTFEEIGSALDSPLNTVKSQHRRALIELRRLLQR